MMVVKRIAKSDPMDEIIGDWYRREFPTDYQKDGVSYSARFRDIADKVRSGSIDATDVGASYLDSAVVDTIFRECRDRMSRRELPSLGNTVATIDLPDWGEVEITSRGSENGVQFYGSYVENDDDIDFVAIFSLRGTADGIVCEGFEDEQGSYVVCSAEFDYDDEQGIVDYIEAETLEMWDRYLNKMVNKSKKVRSMKGTRSVKKMERDEAVRALCSHYFIDDLAWIIVENIEDYERFLEPFKESTNKTKKSDKMAKISTKIGSRGRTSKGRIKKGIFEDIHAIEGKQIQINGKSYEVKEADPNGAMDNEAGEYGVTATLYLMDSDKRTYTADIHVPDSKEGSFPDASDMTEFLFTRRNKDAEEVGPKDWDIPMYYYQHFGIEPKSQVDVDTVKRLFADWDVEIGATPDKVTINFRDDDAHEFYSETVESILDGAGLYGEWYDYSHLDIYPGDAMKSKKRTTKASKRGNEMKASKSKIRKYDANLYDMLVDIVGKERMFDELIFAMRDDEVQENLEYIARMFDIDTDDIGKSRKASTQDMIKALRKRGYIVRKADEETEEDATEEVLDEPIGADSEDDEDVEVEVEVDKSKNFTRKSRSGRSAKSKRNGSEFLKSRGWTKSDDTAVPENPEPSDDIEDVEDNVPDIEDGLEEDGVDTEDTGAEEGNDMDALIEDGVTTEDTGAEEGNDLDALINKKREALLGDADKGGQPAFKADAQTPGRMQPYANNYRTIQMGQGKGQVPAGKLGKTAVGSRKVKRV